MRSLILILLALATGACSSLPNKKTLALAGAGVAVGALYGMSRPDFQSQNATMYGAVGGLIGTTAGLVLDVDGNNSAQLKIENEELKNKLSDFQKTLDPKLIAQGSSLFSAPLPKEMNQLISPGEWKRYKLDQWVQDPNQANIWYRQIEMFEITPPISK